MSRMFCYAVRGGNERIKKNKNTHTHTAEGVCLLGAKWFPPGRSHGSFEAYRCSVFVCVTTCGCRAPVKRHHMSRESRMASASLRFRLQFWPKTKRNKKIIWNLDADERRLCETSQNQFMYSRVSKLQDYINIILAHVICNVHASCVHIFTKKKKTPIYSEEPEQKLSLKKKERGLAGHSAGRCLSIWNERMSVCITVVRL